MKKMIFLLMTALLPIASPGLSRAGEDKGNEMRSLVEHSSLPREQKESLLRQAHSALQSGIPSDDITVIVKRGLARGWQGSALEESLATAEKAKRQGLPYRPVLDRIQQGLSKGVPADRVSRATTLLTEKLSKADGIVTGLIKSGMKTGAPPERTDAVQNIARALEREIPGETLVKMGITRAKSDPSLSRFSNGVSTMTSLIEMGMPVDHAAKLIGKAMERGYSDKDMIMLEKDMSFALREGWKMEEAVGMMDSSMERGHSGNLHKGMDPGQVHGSGSGVHGTGHHGHK
ncbi:MAG: hypothetical protein U0411_13340 [Thermodesulfovibrionales bacterium]